MLPVKRPPEAMEQVELPAALASQVVDFDKFEQELLAKLNGEVDRGDNDGDGEQ